MAERRMFAKTIIDSDAFLDMPLSTQALYFHLSMRADDDGFVNSPKKVQRVIGCGDDDIKLLIAKKFIIPFESGVVVIKHWKIHNYIRNDRYKETVYQEEKALLAVKENKAYTLGIPDGYQMDTQDRLGKDRIGEDSVGEVIDAAEVMEITETEVKRINYQLIADMYNDTCVSFPRLTKLSEKRKKAIKARLNTYSIDDFKRLFEKAEASSFLKGEGSNDWSATFDWLIKDANMAKVLDGNYDDKPKKAAPKSNSFNNYPQRQYDCEAMERMLLNQQAPPETAATNPDIKARAEALQKQLGGN